MTYREMFHTSRWHEDTRYLSPMVCLQDGTQVFLWDCVSCTHSLLGVVNGIVKKYFMKVTKLYQFSDPVSVIFIEKRKLCAEVDIMLTLEQYQQAVPSTLASYLSYGSWIIFESIAIPISDILGLCHNPLSLLEWDPLSATLSQVSREVSADAI